MPSASSAVEPLDAEGEVRARGGVPAPRSARRRGSARAAPRDAARRPRARAPAAVARLRGCGRRPARVSSSRSSARPGSASRASSPTSSSASASSADVLRGRCLSYGEGITYWPLVEILIAIGVEPESVIGTSPPETQLAFRRLLETRAAERPQVVVVDDLQWAEPVFIDLVEHVADLSRDAPIFLLCIARTELLDLRPSWGGGKMNATSLLLEPLGAEECAELMEHPRRRRGARRRAARADHGRVGREPALRRGDARDGARARRRRRDRRAADDPRAPPGAHRLARRRRARRHGARMRSRARSSIAARWPSSSPERVRAGVESHLATLVRKELIRSTSPTFPEDEGVPLPAPPHPRRGLRVAPEGDAGRAARALRRLARDARASSSVTRSSGTTSSRRSATARELDPGRPGARRLSRRASRASCVRRSRRPRPGRLQRGRSPVRRALAIAPADDPLRRLTLAPDLASRVAGVRASSTRPPQLLAEAAAVAEIRVVARHGDGRRATSPMLFTDGDRRRRAARPRRRPLARAGAAGDRPKGSAIYWWSCARRDVEHLRRQGEADACEHGLVHSRVAPGNARPDSTTSSGGSGPRTCSARRPSRRGSSARGCAVRGERLALLQAGAATRARLFVDAGATSIRLGSCRRSAVRRTSMRG